MDEETMKIKKYVVELDKSEILEFCLHVMWDQMKCKKHVWLLLFVIAVADCVILPEAVWVFGVIILAAALVPSMVSYCAMKKMLLNQQWTIWVENGMIKDMRGNASEMPCSSVQRFHRTRRLQLIGYMRSKYQAAWYVIPLRMFADDQEREQLLEKIRHPQTAECAVDMESAPGRESESEPLRFSYMLTEEKWMAFARGAMDAVRSGVLGKTGYMGIVIISYCAFAAVLTVCLYWVRGYFSWILFIYGLLIALLMTVRLFFRNPDKALKQQAHFAMSRGNMCGNYEIALSEDGVTEYLPMGAKNFLAWETFGWLVETPEAFLLFQKNRKRYCAVAKESFQDWKQVADLHALCAKKGVEAVQGKRMRYMSNGAFALSVAGCMALFIGVLFVGMFWRQTKEAVQEVQRRQTSYEQEAIDRMETDGADVQRAPAAYENDAFDPADYPDYVSLEEQVEVLVSLGFDVPQQTVESMRERLLEYNMQAYVEGYPYTSLLMELGVPQYDDDWTIASYPGQVFWFDFEGTDYSTVLLGMCALAEGSCLDSVSDISEDMSDVDWERGAGTITVRLTWEGQQYAWKMEMYYDWLDSDVLGVLNALLPEDSEKRFYAAGDNGQGALVFFCTPDWAEEFTEKTGLEMFCSTIQPE